MDEVARLNSMAGATRAVTPDLPGHVALEIRRASRSGADPWLLIGVLIEGMAHTIATAIPEERKDECIAAALRLLADRTGSSV